MNIVKKKKLITWDEVLERSNGGKDVFKREIPQYARGEREFNHPLRVDRRPSSAISKEKGVYFLLDFAGKLPTMTALQFIMHRYNLDFVDAVNKMANDLGIESSGRDYSARDKVLISSTEPEEEDLFINILTQGWKDEHYEFWKNTGVTKQHCRKYNTFAVKEAAVNRKRIPIGYKEVVWAYFSSGENKMKLYFPERGKKQKFRTNLPNTYLWNWENVKEDWSSIRIQKSFKDLLVSTVIDEKCIATQNESAKILIENNYDRLQNHKGRKIMCYGSDFQGWHESYLVTTLTGWDYFNIPGTELPSINDEYSYAKKYGIKKLEELYKLKNII